jgi:adenylate kinase
VAYRQQTEPLLDYYGKKKLLVTVEGLGAVDEIFSRIRTHLDPLAG